VWSTNTGLHDYYMRKGFRPCGTCGGPGLPVWRALREISGGDQGGIGVPVRPKFTETSADSQFRESLVNVEKTAKLNLAAIWPSFLTGRLEREAA
jgi:hypothetical protein